MNVFDAAPTDDAFTILATSEIDADQMSTYYKDPAGSSGYCYRYRFTSKETRQLRVGRQRSSQWLARDRRFADTAERARSAGAVHQIPLSGFALQRLTGGLLATDPG